MTHEQIVEQLRPLWRKWRDEAAAKDGITPEELDRQLAAGEALLQVDMIITPPKPD
jgi:hypothetical protein